MRHTLCLVLQLCESMATLSDVDYESEEASKGGGGGCRSSSITRAPLAGMVDYGCAWWGVDWVGGGWKGGSVCRPCGLGGWMGDLVN